MIQIDKYVALPPRPDNFGGKRGIKPAKYPWKHMEPGDSFFVPGARAAATDKREGAKIHFTTVNGRRMVPNSKWALRAVTENGVVGVRVWRVE